MWVDRIPGATSRLGDLLYPAVTSAQPHLERAFVTAFQVRQTLNPSLTHCLHCCRYQGHSFFSLAASILLILLAAPTAFSFQPSYVEQANGRSYL